MSHDPRHPFSFGSDFVDSFTAYKFIVVPVLFHSSKPFLLHVTLGRHARLFAAVGVSAERHRAPGSNGFADLSLRCSASSWSGARRASDGDVAENAEAAEADHVGAEQPFGGAAKQRARRGRRRAVDERKQSGGKPTFVLCDEAIDVIKFTRLCGLFRRD